MSGPVPFARALATAESELDRLAGRLDIPVDGRSVPCITALAIARQAFVVYGGLRREAVADPLGINGPILLRSLAEAAILVRWMDDSPALRADMYAAEDYRQRLAAIDPFKSFRARRGATGPLYSRAEQTAMRATVRDVRERARAAREPIGEKGQLTPTVEEMSRSTGDTAMWEAYQIIYRISSQWTHVSGWSLSQHRVESRPDGSHLVIAGPYPGIALRAMAAPSMAHLIGSTSRICSLGIEAEARIWQDAIIEWPTPLIESVKP